VLFGTRQIDATEHQDGLILAIATESIVKLVAFIAVGLFVTFVLFGGPTALFERALERPDTAALLTHEPNPATIFTMTMLSLFAIVLLPRQFHVTVVENQGEAEIRRAAWLFPLYLVLINLFVVPVAIGTLLLTVRRIAIPIILSLAYLYYRSAGDAQLASIGLLSFAAIAQLAPAFFGGLIWRHATARGALAGMIAGVLVWAYTLLLPSIVESGIIDHQLLAEGPLGLALLRPQALLGLELPPLVHGVLWSLALNVAAYIAFSLQRKPVGIEQLQANLFVPPALAPATPSFRL